MEQEELTTRLTKLEFLVERHDQSLSELWEHHLSFSKETTKALAAINKILIQIRAFAVGAAVDGDHTASSYGTTSHTPNASDSGFIAFDSVTEANCIAWAQAQVGQSEVEAALAAQIEADKTPTSAAGVPWAA